ncbi:MAG: bifunctional phosphoribosylaminoimidazolecarboxamide formyltransferase/IMP cyclohydrolase [Candidatus Gastranaerophilales bacterium]|nr:bifunctional phosphoribosylaminoimidazolecarboxamide formyltransferase/IMP cyclohydrolase [Candidatus Gastranaerophilales bacterium]
MKKRALISVYDKINVVQLAETLIKSGYEILASGGTYKFLQENSISCTEISKYTGADEILGGRVKTLHPKIAGAILARNDVQSDIEDLKANDIESIDIVVVNLYPFSAEKTVDFIDIGGVTLIRAAAKNYKFKTVITSPEQYVSLIKELEENNGITTEAYRKDLAKKAFELTFKYDKEIFATLFEKNLDDNIAIDLNLLQELRYGENPHQQAGLYDNGQRASFELLNGKELSFNNIADMNAGYKIVSEFIDVDCACIIKHNNPCGAALGETVAEAYQKALECDPISAFGGIVAFNNTVDEKTAKLMKEIFLEVIIAPDFEDKAIEILKEKKNLRLVKVFEAPAKFKNKKLLDIKNTGFGTLVQMNENKELTKDNFKVVTETKPDARMVEDMIFAWKVAKHVKSNAVVIAKDKRTIGIGAGQTSRIASMEIALAQACDEAKDAVIASDGFFPATDNIQIAGQSRISAIIQPGGSIKDQDVIDECNRYNIAMIFTGIRHFFH